MNYAKILEDLLEMKADLEEAIAAVSLLALGHDCRGRLTKTAAKKTGRPKETRGRKSMPAAERKVVSKRMKDFWAERRRKRLQGPSIKGVDLTKVKIPPGQPIS